MHYAYVSQKQKKQKQQKQEEERTYIFSVETICSLKCLNDIADGLVDLGITPDKVYGNIPRKIFRVEVPLTIEADDIISALKKVDINAEKIDLATTIQPNRSTVKQKRMT